MLLLIVVWYSTIWVTIVYLLDSLLLDIMTTFKIYFILWTKKKNCLLVWINIIIKTKEICEKNLMGSSLGTHQFHSGFKILPSFLATLMFLPTEFSHGRSTRAVGWPRTEQSPSLLLVINLNLYTQSLSGVQSPRPYSCLFESGHEGLNSKGDETLQILLFSSFLSLAPPTTTLAFQAIWAKCEGSFMKWESAFPMCGGFGGYLQVISFFLIKNMFPDMYRWI